MADVVAFAEEKLKWLIGEMSGLLDFIASNARSWFHRGPYTRPGEGIAPRVLL